MPRRRRDTMGTRELKMKRFLKNTFYRKSNGYLVSVKLPAGCAGVWDVYRVVMPRTAALENLRGRTIPTWPKSSCSIIRL